MTDVQATQLLSPGLSVYTEGRGCDWSNAHTRHGVKFPFLLPSLEVHGGKDSLYRLLAQALGTQISFIQLHGVTVIVNDC